MPLRWGSQGKIACKGTATCSCSSRKVALMFSVRADTMGFQKAKSVVWLLGLFGVLWVVAGWIAAGAFKQMMLGGIALIVLAITLRILNNWREGFYLFMVWLLFEDLVRKYMGNNMYIFFAKDFLVAVTYASLLLNLQRRREATFRPPFLPALTAFLLLGVAVPRPCSVFVSDGRFASYIVLVFILGFGTAAYLLVRAHRGVKIAFPAVALAAVAAVMTGGRGAFSWVLISTLVLTVGLLWGVPRRWSQGQRLFKAIRRSYAGAGLALLVTVAIFPKEIV